MVSIQAPSSAYEGSDLTIEVSGLNAYSQYIFMFTNSRSSDIGAIKIGGNTIYSEYNRLYSSNYKYHTWTPTSSAATISLPIISDNISESSENLSFYIKKDSGYGGSWRSKSVQLKDNLKSGTITGTSNYTSVNNSYGSINEGDSIRFNFAGYSPYTSYYYTIEGLDSSDSTSSLKSSIYMGSTGSGYLDLSIKEDQTTEGNENVTLTLYKDSSRTSKTDNEFNFTVNDTSVAPVPTISLSGNNSSIDEGAQSTFTATNLSPGSYYYRFKDPTGLFTDSDLQNSYRFTGSLYIYSTGSSNTISFKPSADLKTEGIESPILEIYNNRSFSGNPVATKSFTINDTSIEPPVILKYGANSNFSNPALIDEGKNISFQLTNLSRKKYYWKFDGISQDDITSKISGEIESYYSTNWSKYIYFNTFLDDLTEGNEKVSFILSKESSYTNPVAQANFILNDTSKTPLPSVKINGANIRSNEGESAIIPLTITTFPTDEKPLFWKLSGNNLQKEDLATRFGDFSEQIQLGSSELPTSKTVRDTTYRSGNYTLNIPFANDNTTENTESYRLDFYSNATLSGTPLGSTNITVYDTSQDPPKSFLNSATVEKKTINLYFSDPINPGELSSSYFKISRNNKNIPIQSINLNDSNNIAELTLKKELNPKDIIDINYLAPRNAALQAFSEKVTFEDNSKPVPIRGIAYSDRIELRFSESLQEASIHKKRFEVKSSNRIKKIDSIKLEANEGILTVNLLKKIDINDDSIEISYYDLNGDQSSKILEDKYGNDVATFKEFQVSNQVSDGQEIQVTLAEVDEDIITLGFDIELDSNSKPNNGMFRVMVNNNKNKIEGIILDADKREAYLTLKKPISNNDIVKLSYTDAKGDQKNNVIQSKYGGDLATFKKLAVENLSATSFDPPGIVDSYYDNDTQAIVVEFDEIIANTKIKKSRFKAYSLNNKGNKTRHKIIDIVSSNDDTVVELIMKNQIPDIQDQLLFDYRDPKGDQKNGIVEDLQGNDFPTTKGISIDF